MIEIVDNVGRVLYTRRANNLVGANLAGKDLRWANLVGSNLATANLAGADLTGADLTRAILTDANLRGSILRCANFMNANLDGADLSGADMTNSKNLPQEAREKGVGKVANSQADRERDLIIVQALNLFFKSQEQYKRLEVVLREDHNLARNERIANEKQDCTGTSQVVSGSIP